MSFCDQKCSSYPCKYRLPILKKIFGTSIIDHVCFNKWKMTLYKNNFIKPIKYFNNGKAFTFPCSMDILFIHHLKYIWNMLV